MFESRGLVRAEHYIGEGLDGGILVVLTGEGLEEAESLKSSLVPAADRFVHIDDNSGKREAAQEAVERLAAEVRKSNSLFINGAEKDTVETELTGLRTLLNGSVVRAQSIWQTISGNGVVRWIAQQSVGAAIGALALAAIAALAALLGFG